jgi:N-acyl-D-amino-acid deacylase
MNYDLVIYNVEIVDGTGSPAYTGDVAVQNKRIEKIGDIGSHSANREINAAGLTLTPGFIDSHSHADLTFAAGSPENEKLRMGVTTEVFGQCGFSPYPLSSQHASLRQKSMAGFLPGVTFSWDWTNLAEYKAVVEKRGMTHHAVPLVGHGSIRQAIMGDSQAKPSPADLDKMCGLVDEAMGQGAYGLSTGLIYAPGCFSDTDEVTALARVAADHDKLYVTHVRGETASLIDTAMDEALAVSRTSGAKLQISHLKVIGLRPENQGRINSVIENLEAAKAQGIDIGFDCYPYTQGSTILSALLPRWAHAQGVSGLLEHLRSPEQRRKIRNSIEADDHGGEDWLLACGFEAVKVGSVSESSAQGYVGRNLREIADETGQDPYDALFDILIEDNAGAIMVFSMLRPEDMHTVITHPLTMIGTDAIPCPPGQGRPHPRGYGSFPKILGRLVRELGLMSLEQAIRKMTGIPARRLGLKDRGIIAEGMWADMVIFDRNTIIDRATYEDPRQHPDGLHYVFVDGRLAVEHGELRDINAGHFL